MCNLLSGDNLHQIFFQRATTLACSCSQKKFDVNFFEHLWGRFSNPTMSATYETPCDDTATQTTEPPMSSYDGQIPTPEPTAEADPAESHVELPRKKNLMSPDSESSGALDLSVMSATTDTTNPTMSATTDDTATPTPEGPMSSYDSQIPTPPRPRKVRKVLKKSKKKIAVKSAKQAEAGALSELQSLSSKMDELLDSLPECQICQCVVSEVISPCGECSLRCCSDCLKKTMLATHAQINGWETTLQNSQKCPQCRQPTLYAIHNGSLTLKSEIPEVFSDAHGCQAYIWRVGSTELVRCGCKCNGQYCKRHALPVQRTSEPMVFSDGDVTYTGRHFAPTQEQIINGYKPIWFDEDTERYYVPWFAPGSIFRNAFVAQAQELMTLGHDLYRAKSRKFGKMPKELKAQQLDWPEDVWAWMTTHSQKWT